MNNDTIVYAVDLTVYDPDLPGTWTLYYATHGIVYGGHYYEPRLQQPGNFTQSLFSSGTTRGASKVGYGEIVLINTEGGLDAFVNYGLDGRPLVLRKIIAGVATILMSCSMEQPVPTWDTVPIRIKDKQQLLATPIQSTKYAGTNTLPDGEEGTADIKGKPKPLLYGPVPNATPVCVNTSRLIYQGHESALQDIPAVYDKGVSLVRGADYSSAAEMQANQPSPGEYRAYLAGGMFRLGSSPVGQITFDGIEGTTSADRTAVQIAKRIALRKILSSELDAADITALDAANSAEIGIYITDETNIAAALDEVLGSIGAWYGFDSLGVLNMGRLEAPSGTPAVTLTPVEVLSVERKATNDAGRGVPPYRVNLGYARNYTVQDAGSLAGRVSAAWVNGTGLSGSGWSGITYGNGLFVAVRMGSNAVATSPDGVEWTIRTLPATGAWKAVVYGGGGFVAITGGNPTDVAATSTDGITWTARTLPAEIDWSSIAYGGGVFVAVGSDTVATSADGITWTLRTIAAGVWNSVTYGGGLFATVAYSGANRAATSPDGITWTVRTLPVSAQWTSIAYGGGLFVAISAAAAAVSSPDGVTWTQRTLPADVSWRSIAYGDGQFAAVPIGLSNVFVAMSGDGISWVRSSTPASINSSGVAYGNGSFVSIPYVEGQVFVAHISPEMRHALFVSKAYRTVSATAATILTKHPTAGELNIDALIVSASDASTEAARLLALYGADRDYLAVKLRPGTVAADLLGKVIRLQIPRYGYDAGKLFVVVGVTYDYALGAYTLEIWG